MAITPDVDSRGGQAGMLDTQADNLVKRTKSVAGATGGSKDDAKITKAASDFESILLGSWLQQAESSFATVPGGDEDEDGDSGKGQFQGIAMQALAGSLTKSGGIGIAKMIAKSLHSAANAENKVVLGPSGIPTTPLKVDSEKN